MSAPARLFAPSSVWNQSLPVDAPLDPGSTAMTQALAEEAEREQAANNGPWINTSYSSTPIYVAGPSQPPVFVTLDNAAAWWRINLQAAFEAVPIPANAHQAAGPDAQITVYQPSTDRLWEFFHARKLADGWHAAWGGAIEHVSQSPGYYTSTSWAGSGSYWGASATSLPLVAGTITISELQSGRIEHALAMALPYPRAGVYAWPAQRSDGTGSEPTDIPEGAQLRLDPSLDIPALHLPPGAEMLALAAQRYGIVVRDQTHHAIGFYGEDPTPRGSDPYDGPRGFYGGLSPTRLLSRFPWRSLQILRMTLHSTSH